MALFIDRVDAGRQLAQSLLHLRGEERLVVIALPRGGVPIACEVARQLEAPLDIFVIRKLGAPINPELAIGAIASGGVQIMNDRVMRSLALDTAAVARIVAAERLRIAQIEQGLRGDRPPFPLGDRCVIIVDDGLATGATMRAAVEGVRRLHPNRVVAAAPVGSEEAVRLVGQVADEMVCLHAPPEFQAVAQWYVTFDQLTDRRTREILTGC